MLDKLVVIDYYNGAGGEFFASFVNAHWGQPLIWDHQQNPNHFQKWFNSYSLVTPNWHNEFQTSMQLFLQKCDQQNISKIAIPYHLHKWPMHQHCFKSAGVETVFLKIDSSEYEKDIATDFAIKVTKRPIKDFSELAFYIKNFPQDKQIAYIEQFRHNTVTVEDLNLHSSGNHVDPTVIVHDIVVSYRDFFVEFDRTADAYAKLCQDLNLAPSNQLLQALIDRNQQNLEQRKKYVSNV